MSDLEQATREWVENTLERLDMVAWDRFVAGDDPNVAGRYLKVYGWIDREDDAYKDFVIVTFYPDTANNLYGFTTSSDRYTMDIHRRLFGDEPDQHNDCRRVEHAFEVPNAVELGEQTTLEVADE